VGLEEDSVSWKGEFGLGLDSSFLAISRIAGRGRTLSSPEERAFPKNMVEVKQHELAVICSLGGNICKAISF
jgi:hypothetical protein